MDSPFGPKRTAENAETAVNLDATLLNRVELAFATAAERADAAIRAVPSSANIDVHFEVGLRAVLDAAAADPDTTQLCLVEAPGLGVKAVELKEAGLQRFVDLLDRELAAAHGGQAPPLVAEMVVGGIYEVAQRTARGGDVKGLPALADQLTELWLPALRNR